MLSDLVDLDNVLDQVNFSDKLGTPLKPFQQLMGCMPPSQAHHLPEPYRWLMTDPNSPIIDFYPKTFTIDMNGKRWPWEAVALLPFLDSKRLVEAMDNIDESLLSQEERIRNSTGESVVMMYDEGHSESVSAIGKTEGFGAIEDSKVISVPFGISDWNFNSDKKAILEPELHPDVEVPLPGFASLHDAPVQSLWRRRNGINVFGSRSRYKTSCLEVSTFMPPLPKIETLAPKLIGTSIFVNYPHFVEGLVTAVSDEHTIVRGRNKAKRWTDKESEKWKVKRDGITRSFQTGEGYSGTGGMIIPDDQTVTLSVRPLKGLTKTKEGTTVKAYAKFEIEVPIISTFWNPSRPDPRLVGVPSRLEKTVFEIAIPLHSAQRPQKVKATVGRKRSNLFPPKNKAATIVSPTERIENANVAKAFYTSSALPHLQGNHGRLVQKKENTGKRNFSSQDATFHLQPWSRIKSNTLILKRPQSNNSSKNHHLGNKGGFHHFSSQQSTFLARGIAGKAKAGPRGRMLAIGLIATSFLVNLSAGISTLSLFGSKQLQKRHQDLKKYLPSSSQPFNTEDLLQICGGDFQTERESNSSTPPLEFAHGTTTLSFIFQGGIIAAVDSRASLGSFVGSKTTQKVLPVNSHILGTMAGGAADCMFWIRKLKAQAILYESIEGSRMTVARASRLLSNALYDNRGLDLSIGTMIMGFDPEVGPPKIYYVDNSGVRIEGDLFAVGSGSSFALGILDNERKHGMTENEAINLGIKAIRHATFRDAYSGGFINVYLITRDGWKKVYTEDLAGSTPVDDDASPKK
jgi:20S proteasome subunit beta 5